MNRTTDPIDYSARLREALTALQKMRARLEAVEQARNEPIAVIGMGCRFPGGADDPDKLWELLREGVDAITQVPRERWDIDAYYDPNPDAPGKTYSRWGGFIHDVDQFDPLFFGISPREARGMDPQQRLLLQVSWEAFEHAGQTRQGLMESRTGVFVGITINDYLKLQSNSGGLDAIDAYRLTGSPLHAAAGRLAYTFGLQGPCMAIDTACSSSLVAVHLACTSLRSGECNLAIAGGVNVILSPDWMIAACKNKMLSPSGRCRTFDARADGFVRGEGCGVVILKRLSEALKDGDRIWAVVRGSAVNQDGPSSGFTVPSKSAQEAVIRAALLAGGVESTQIGYVEAHGTGTPLGDPIEIRALADVYGVSRSNEHALLVGSIKTNMGHLESASGIAGFIKATLALAHREIPTHLHFQEPSPHIAWDEIPIKIPTRRVNWHTEASSSRFAGVSSFGASGTNAHVILEQAPAIPPEESLRHSGIYIIPFSAHTPAALQARTQSYQEFFRHNAQIDLNDVGFTASQRRTHYAYRTAMIGNSAEELVERLDSVRADVIQTVAQPSKLAFVCSGQGPQWWAMGRELLTQEPIFRAVIEECDRLFRAFGDWSLLEELSRDEAQSRLDQTAIAQPAIFALQIALAELWRSWGIVPSAVIGHSVGEIAAAHIAGVLSLPDAVRVAFHRGRLMQRATGLGKMAAVELSSAEAEQAIANYAGRLSIGAINSPTVVTLSGEANALEQAVASLQSRGVTCRMLRVNYAFHSPQMEPFQSELVQALRGLEPRAPTIAIISTVTGQPASQHDYDAAYWGRNIRQPVRFATAVERLVVDGCTTFVELSPHPALAPAMSQCLDARKQPGTVLASLRRGQPERVTMFNSLGALYTLGFAVEWASIYPQGRVVSLPTYPWQQERFWFETQSHRPVSIRAQSAGEQPLLGQSLISPVLKETVFESSLDVETVSFLSDHRVFEMIVVPGTAYVEMIIAAATRIGISNWGIENLSIQEALVIPFGETRIVQVIVSPPSHGRHEFQIVSQVPNGQNQWKTHASGSISQETGASTVSLSGARTHCQIEMPVDDLYVRLKESGVDFGERFRGLAQVWRNASANQAISRIRIPEVLAPEIRAYHLHPALLDQALHTFSAAFVPFQSQQVYLPIAFDRVRWHVQSGDTQDLWGYAVLRTDRQDVKEIIAGDAFLFDSSGRILAEMLGVRFKRASAEALKRALPHSTDQTTSWQYQIDWRRQPRQAVEAFEQPGAWLVATADLGMAEFLAKQLETRGNTVRVIGLSDDVKRIAGEQAWRGVVHLQTRENETFRGLESALWLAQTLARQSVPSRIWFVTQGAQLDNNQLGSIHQSPLWGFARTLALEHPGLHPTCIDLDPAAFASENVRALVDDLWLPDGEDQIAFRNGERLVARLAPLSKLPQAQRLAFTESGTFESLVLRPLARREPAPHEIEIQVRATGLNFRDVLIVLGMYPDGADVLGNECAGTIVAVGKDVRDFQIGDDVVAVATDSFSSFAYADARFAVPKPNAFTFAQAATIPIAFLTADYALNHLGKMRAGERVLIHAAAGGVGMAAVQLAQRAGAEIFATAGSEEKRALLKTLGVHHVMDSRSLAFADEIMRVTNGAGVALVLNSLADEFIPKSLSVLKRNGRFLEIGKRGIWSHEQVTNLGRGIDYHIVYLGEVIERDPGLVQKLFRELRNDFATGVLHPLPVREFPLDSAADAFRFMAQAKHVGKIVLTQPANHPVRASKIGADSTYLITGGLGGIGMVVARWLVEKGARHLVLLGRHGASEAAREAIRSMEQIGAQVVVAQADVSHREQVARVLGEVAQTMPPLRGVIHAAGVLDDGVLAQQTWERFEKVMRPKVDGAWNLHALTRAEPLDFLVLFGAAASIIGSAGQSNYAAANAYLGALAHYRHALGLPALCVDWGAWSDVGMAASLGERMSRMGLGIISPEQGMQIFAQILASSAPQVIAMPLAVARFKETHPAPMFADLVSAPSKTEPAQPVDTILRRIADAPPNKRKSILQAHVRDHSLRILGLNQKYDLDPRQPLHELGLDSLMAVELRNALAASLQRSLPSTLLFDHPTVDALTEFLALEILPSEVSATSETPTAEKKGLQELAQLSEDEAEALLLKELERGRRNG